MLRLCNNCQSQIMQAEMQEGRKAIPHLSTDWKVRVSGPYVGVNTRVALFSTDGTTKSVTVDPLAEMRRPPSAMVSGTVRVG